MQLNAMRELARSLGGYVDSSEIDPAHWSLVLQDVHVSLLAMEQLSAAASEFAEVFFRNSTFEVGALSTLLKWSKLRRCGLECANITDADAIVLGKLSELERLGVEGTKTYDEFFFALNAPRLRILAVSKTAITDGGIEALANASPLEEIFANDTRITDRAIRSLASRRLLKQLNAIGTSTSDEAVTYLAECEALSALDLSRSRVTGRNLGSLQHCSLWYLSMAANSFGDESVPQLVQIESLKYLDVSRTDLTDHGLARLSSLKNLCELYVGNCNVTKLGVSKFRRARPDCYVSA